MHRLLTIVLLDAFLSIAGPRLFAQQIGKAYGSEPSLKPLPIGEAIRHESAGSTTFDWQKAALESFYFLGIEHGLRMTQSKTRRELNGPFFNDWAESVANIHGWGDGDSVFTNYVAHPMQGAVAGFIQIQNDSRGRSAELSDSRTYWYSRLRAMGWSAFYSTQFELGPISEASLGNVGKKKDTAGYTDLIITPIGGFGLIVLEDALDKRVVTKLEQRTDNLVQRRFFRMAFNPTRSLANLLRGKMPWYRDSRPISYSPGCALTGPSGSSCSDSTGDN